MERRSSSCTQTGSTISVPVTTGEEEQGVKRTYDDQDENHAPWKRQAVEVVNLDNSSL